MTLAVDVDETLNAITHSMAFGVSSVIDVATVCMCVIKMYTFRKDHLMWRYYLLNVFSHHKGLLRELSLTFNPFLHEYLC